MDKLSLIKTAARDLFNELGFDRATTRAIAERAQVGDERSHRRAVGRTPGDSAAKIVRQSPEQVVARAIREQRGDDRRERRLGRKLRG
jgi:hypothetical protein